jgi:hypothetical protein
MVCVDLDHTLASDEEEFDRDTVGLPYDGARRFMHALKELGLEIVIYTVRCSVESWGLPRANSNRRVVEAWLKKNDIPYDHVWMETGKPHAAAFVDDRAVPCRPADNDAAYTAAMARVKKLVN